MMKKVPLHSRRLRKNSKRTTTELPSGVGSKRSNMMKTSPSGGFKRPGQFSSAAALFQRTAPNKASF